MNEKPFVATEKHVSARWGGGFWCKLCGHHFKVGDIVRWVYANSTPGACCGNFHVCITCDGPDVLQRGIDDCNATIKAAKRWGLYGPDWQEDVYRIFREEARAECDEFE